MKKNSAPKNSKPNEKPVVKKFTMPEAVLDQLNECSGGGFILIAMDQHGQPEVYAHYDNSIIAMGMNSFAASYFENACAHISDDIQDSYGQGQDDFEEED